LCHSFKGFYFSLECFLTAAQNSLLGIPFPSSMLFLDFAKISFSRLLLERANASRSSSFVNENRTAAGRPFFVMTTSSPSLLSIYSPNLALASDNEIFFIIFLPSNYSAIRGLFLSSNAQAAFLQDLLALNRRLSNGG